MNQQNLYHTPNANLVSNREQYDEPKVLSWSGRLGRMRYITYIISVYFLLVIMGSMSAVVLRAFPDSPKAIVIIFALGGLFASMLFVISVMKRRLNDFNASGWWTLLMVVPVANSILGLVMLFMPGTQSANRYGNIPTANKNVAMLAIVFGVIFLMGILAAMAIPQYQAYVQRAQQLNQQSIQQDQ